MARGRHRNAALHRVLIPTAVGGAALACAGASWLVGDALVLRGLTAGSAAAAVTGAVLLRRWDIRAGRIVARERAAKAGLNWRNEERQARLEQARDQIGSLEQKISAKRADLERLRSEHAELLRRYATAETERAKALEGRRLLALEAAAPAKALPAQATDHRTSGGAPTPLTYIQAYEALSHLSRSVARQREQAEAAEAAEAAETEREREERPEPRLEPVVPPPQRNGAFDFFSRSASHNAG
jgi:septal ring factor EnvC (AmiA/AmiB activator)